MERRESSRVVIRILVEVRRRRDALVGCVLMVCALTLAGCGKSAQVPDGNGRPVGGLGVIDAQRVLADSAPGKKAKDTLSTFTKNRQTLIELDERELRRMEEDFVKQGSVLSPSAKREREEAFRRRMAEYQQKAGEMNREVQEKQKEVLDGFRDKLERVVGRIAKASGLQLVVERGRGTTTLYSEDALDISQRVIDELNKE
ncbi:MAG: OmpH family outer membrane protein [Nitrospiraceae bacterium]